MRSKHINTSEEKASQVTKVTEQEYENSFGLLVDTEKLIHSSSGVALDDDIAESILNMVNVGKYRIENFRQKRLICKVI